MTKSTNVNENPKRGSIFITGASSGIGEAIAYQMAAKGYPIILAARRLERLQTLAKELTSTYGIRVHIMPLDVRQRELVLESVAAIPSDFPSISVLINNAGLAWGLNPIQEGDYRHWDTMIDTNIKGLLWVTQAVLPTLMANKAGHIINIGSIAGKEAYPNGNVYCATKAAVDSLSKGMRIDLAPHNIRVSVVHPGAVETEFSNVRFSGDHERAALVYQGFTPLRGKDVAEVIDSLIHLPLHVNVNDVVVMPTAQPAAGIIHRSNN